MRVFSQFIFLSFSWCLFAVRLVFRDGSFLIRYRGEFLFVKYKGEFFLSTYTGCAIQRPIEVSCFFFYYILNQSW